MENKNDEMITMSRYAFEKMQSKDERNDHWRNVTIIILIILLVVTNAMWLVAWNQYDYVDDYSISAEQDGSGINIVGGGDIEYEPDSNSTEAQEQNPQ